MRKSRLVILPTRRLDRIGFLLLFLSCPVIGDWGRIQPDTEASDKAIQTAKEGTCGLQRDTSSQLPSLLNPDGFPQCRPSEFNDNEPIKNQIDTRRTDVRRMRRTSETQRIARESVERRLSERRDVRRIERNIPVREETRNVRERRSRSVEHRRLSRSRSAERRNEPRSLSLSRLEERSVRIRRDDATRRDSRLLLARQNREVRSERRETVRLERENNRRSLRLSANRRDVERTRENEREARRVALTRREDARRQVVETKQRRLSLARVERDSSRRIESNERRLTRARSAEPARTIRNAEREVTRARSVESLRTTRDTERVRRIERNAERRRESDARRTVALLREVRNEMRVDRRFQKGSDVRMERFDEMRFNRMTVEPKIVKKDLGLEEENGGDEFLGGVMEWIGLKHYESPKLGDWSTNCVIGAVTYFLTSRQVKSA